MVMPGADGQECFKALKAIDPGVRAILSTGYGLDGHAQDALAAGMVGYVQKPYHMDDLQSPPLPTHWPTGRPESFDVSATCLRWPRWRNTG